VFEMHFFLGGGILLFDVWLNKRNKNCVLTILLWSSNNFNNILWISSDYTHTHTDGIACLSPSSEIYLNIFSNKYLNTHLRTISNTYWLLVHDRSSGQDLSRLAFFYSAYKYFYMTINIVKIMSTGVSPRNI